VLLRAEALAARIAQQAVLLRDELLDVTRDVTIVHPVSIRPSTAGSVPDAPDALVLSVAMRWRSNLFVTAVVVVGAVFAGATTAMAEGPSLALGQRGAEVSLLQEQLKALHYVVGQPGVFDARTARAVIAYRKMTGMDRTDVADSAVFARLASGDGAFTVRYPSQGRHVEGDLTHQVLALIGANGQVQRLYPMSSGKPSTPTRLGIFSVYLREPGTNDKGMVDSSFFSGGDAIHGYAEVPTYAASHGCLRVPIPDALSIYDWVRFGTVVDVYYR